jgi:hypothetical protein
VEEVLDLGLEHAAHTLPILGAHLHNRRHRHLVQVSVSRLQPAHRLVYLSRDPLRRKPRQNGRSTGGSLLNSK